MDNLDTFLVRIEKHIAPPPRGAVHRGRSVVSRASVRSPQAARTTSAGSLGNVRAVAVAVAMFVAPIEIHAAQTAPRMMLAANSSPPLARLVQIAALGQNWDGRHAAGPSRVALKAARRVLEFMVRCEVANASGPHVAPGVEGDIGIEWRRGSRELHVYCNPDGAFEVLHVSGEGDGEEHVGDFSVVEDGVRWFRG